MNIHKKIITKLKVWSAIMGKRFHVCMLLGSNKLILDS